MGMESYFIKLRPQHPEVALMSTELLVEQLKKNGLIVVVQQDNFVLENVFVMRVEESEGRLSEVSLEGCLSWFDEGLEKCYEISEVIHNKIVPIELLQPDNVQIARSKDIFFSSLTRFYKEKYHQFVSTYGDVKVRILPDKPFFDYIEKSQKQSFLKRIFRK
jgi:hypothetical protein